MSPRTSASKSTPADEPTPERVLRLRRPEDIVAAVPLVLGFAPQESVVLISKTRGSRSFHARVDLPEAGELPELSRMLVRAAVSNHASTGLVVVYTADEERAEEAADHVRAALVREGIEAPVGLWVHDQHYRDLDGHEEPRPCDSASHPFTAAAIYDGQVTYASRAELVDSLVNRDPDAVEAVHMAATASRERLLARIRHPLGPATPGAFLRETETEAAEVFELVRSALRDDLPLDDDALARLLAILTFAHVRDRFWGSITRLGARKHVTFWSDVTRRSHLELVNRPAALLAYAAWMEGNGALAWCAIDRCRESEPDNHVAYFVESALRQALHPDEGETMVQQMVSALEGHVPHG